MNKHYKALELDKVLDMLADRCGCEDTRERAVSLQPCTSYREAVRTMALTLDTHSLTNRYGTPSIYGIKPCTQPVGRAKIGGMLSMRELLDIAALLKTTRTLQVWKRQSDHTETALDYLFSQLESNKSLEEEITSSILSEEEIADRASPELSDIRRKIRQSQQKARDQLDKITRSTTQQKYLQEQIVTIRNGRFVVPVKAEYRNEIKGLIHDTSSSGATLFVEPMSVVEANNQIRELQSKEAHEINRILLEFSAQVGAFGDSLLNNYDILLELDLCFAKSKLADTMRATAPILVEQGETHLKKARHPLIDPEKIVPVDIQVGGEFDTLVITGPNTGGKTVALKTLGLLTLMAMSGLMLPCGDESSICIYSQVLADIGDEQSIEQSLSTFSAHMTNIISILGAADQNTLVLIDELGAGTDPVEGAALAVAIIDKLRRLGAKIAATTHYAEIKMYALQTPGVENGSCEFDVATLRPTYRLLIGIPGRSNAFAISQRLGLTQDVIEAAKNQVSHENARFEDVVSGLEEIRQELEQEKKLAEHYRLEAEQAKRQAQAAREELEANSDAELARAREKARSIVEQVKYQSDQLLNELEELKKQKDKADFSATVSDIRTTFKAYVRDLEDAADPVIAKKTPAYHLPRPLKRGDIVYLSDFGSQGTVIAPPDESGYLQVQAGILKTKVKTSSVRLLDKANKQVTKNGGSVNTRSAVKAAKEDARSEVDLRGMTTDEALMELDRYLDTAILSGIKTVTVIHGKGTGALRTAVQNRLKKHRGVRTYRLGTYGEGDAGVTVAELK